MLIYVEGGGNTKLLLSECRRAFRQFLERAGARRGSFEVVASGPRLKALKDFRNALKDGYRDAVLLVDSEELVPLVAATGQPMDVWQHLSGRPGGKWTKPAGATGAQTHLMVACMESWFLADPSALAAYYRGTHNREAFNENALPKQADIEKLDKATVKAALANATRPNKTKGEYNDDSKGTHSFKILATLDPQKIAAASYHARRLFCHLKIEQLWLDCTKFAPAS